MVVTEEVPSVVPALENVTVPDDTGEVAETEAVRTTAFPAMIVAGVAVRTVVVASRTGLITTEAIAELV